MTTLVTLKIKCYYETNAQEWCKNPLEFETKYDINSYDEYLEMILGDLLSNAEMFNNYYRIHLEVLNNDEECIDERDFMIYLSTGKCTIIKPEPEDVHIEMKVGDIVRHFKYETDDKENYHKYLYIIAGLAIDSETKEYIVLYQNMCDKKVWARPAKMFMSEVDHEKYPDIKQKYRFELIIENQ